MSKYSISYLFRTMGSGLYCLNVLLRSERSFYWITKFGPGLGRCTALTESLRLNYSGSLVGLRTELNRAGILQSDGLFIYFFCAPTGYGLSVLPGTDPIITRLLLIFTRYLFFWKFSRATALSGYPKQITQESHRKYTISIGKNLAVVAKRATQVAPTTRPDLTGQKKTDPVRVFSSFF